MHGFFSFTAREARGHAVLAAVVTWIVALAVIGIGRSDTSVLGPLKWADFVHVYALGAAARLDRPELLYDAPALHDLQVALVPESAGIGYLTPNSPQVALAFAPFSAIPYWWAGLLWMAIGLATYGWALWISGRGAGIAPSTLAIAALAFPPSSQMVMYGQTTPLVLLAFVLAWLALQRGQPLLAGLAWSLLWVKPQFGVGLAAILLLSREWRIILGAIAGSAIQFALVSWIWDPDLLRAYAGMAVTLPALRHLLEPDAFKLHGVAALTQLLGPAHWPVWIALAGTLAWRAARVWQSDNPASLRFAVLTLSAFLINPHASIYDGVLLACVAVWLAPHRTIWPWAYAIGVAFLVPTAAVVGVQASTLLLCALCWTLSRKEPVPHSPVDSCQYRDRRLVSLTAQPS